MIDETENNYNENDDQQEIRAKDITAGTFNENQIKQANKEFNDIIKGLFNDKIFRSFYVECKQASTIKVKNIEIKFDNLKDKEVGYTLNGKITLNTSIFDKLKEAFIKLSNKNELTNDDIVSINFFTHEYLHILEKYPYSARNLFAKELSEGLREITAWGWTDTFLRAFYEKDNRSFFDIMASDSPTYKDITYILKPVFYEFKGKIYKNKNIFQLVDEKLSKNSHDDIFEDFGNVLTKLSNKKTSEDIAVKIKNEINRAIKEREKVE